MIAFAAQIEDALMARRFTLKPWKHQRFVERVFGEVGVHKEFARGTVEGLIEYNASKKSLSIVAVINRMRGNGHWVQTVEAFEGIASAEGLSLRIVQFENTRLAAWFGRRPGWSRHINMELGDHAIFHTTTMTTDENPFPHAYPKSVGETFAVQVAAPRGHRQRYGKHVRVMLSGATVDRRTANRAKAWRGKTLSLGLLLDQLFAFAAKEGFKPDRSKK